MPREVRIPGRIASAGVVEGQRMGVIIRCCASLVLALLLTALVWPWADAAEPYPDPASEMWLEVRQSADPKLLEYAAWLSAETGKNYRLPTEAEWEYAARAGSTTNYSWGNDIGRNRAVCDGCGSRWDTEQTAPVGSFAANAWGLHDMHGNVWEWVEDCWHENYQYAPSDGSAWTVGGDCSRRVFRGGSWSDVPAFLRSAYRYRYPRSRRFTLGERLESGLLDVLEECTDAAYSKNKRPQLNTANRRLSSVRHLWRLAYKLRVISQKRYFYGSQQPVDIGAWRKSRAVG